MSIPSEINEPLETLLERYNNVFDIENILSRLNTDNLTDQERANLLSIPLGIINQANRISDLTKWLIRYHADSENKVVSDIGLLLAIEEVESLRSDLIVFATDCIARCNKEAVYTPCFPANKNLLS